MRDTLAFFDHKSSETKGHVSAVVAVMGEDMGIALVQHYLSNIEGISSHVVMEFGLPKSPSLGTQEGNRLDRWLLQEAQNGEARKVFQVEIKNWSATAIGGRALSLDASQEQLRAYRVHRWKHYWNAEASNFKTINMGKVLTRMVPPTHTETPTGSQTLISPPIASEEIEPMIVFWAAVHHEGTDDPTFRVPLPPSESGFDHVTVFSMSNYLRSITAPSIEIAMPSARKRIELLHRLIDL